MRSACLLFGELCCMWKAAAEDPFEIHIYEYEPMRLGEYSLEAHLNMNAQGNTLRDATLLTTVRQTHLTLNQQSD